MSVVFLVLPLALLVVLAAVGAFLWAVHHGQFDDLTTPAIRMLHDDDEREPPSPEGNGTPEDDGPRPRA